MGVDAATSELEGLGFHVSVVKSPYYIGVGYVYSSSPGGGDMVPKGSTVVLHII
jgi:eukaryotic-like serine/threonine-protein kinase